MLSMYLRDVYALQNHFLPYISCGQGRAKQKKKIVNIKIIINLPQNYNHT